METPRPCSPLAQMESQAFDEVIFFWPRYILSFLSLALIMHVTDFALHDLVSFRS